MEKLSRNRCFPFHSVQCLKYFAKQVVANYRYFVENDEEPVTAAPVPLKKGIKVRVVAGSMKGAVLLYKHL